MKVYKEYEAVNFDGTKESLKEILGEDISVEETEFNSYDIKTRYATYRTKKGYFVMVSGSDLYSSPNLNEFLKPSEIVCHRPRPEKENLGEFDKILTEMSELHARKNSDYGNAYEKALDFSGYGHASGMLFHKLERFKNLVGYQDKSKVKEESIEDTLIDLANYAVMTLEHIRNHK